MKKFLTILSLILVLSLCVGVLAEQNTQADPTEAAADAEQTAEEAAVDAYRALKGSDRVKNLDALKEELDACVADEKLTREQADLILKHYTQRLASLGEKSIRRQDGAQQQSMRQKKQRNGMQQAPNPGEQQTERQNKRQMKQTPDAQNASGPQNGKGRPETQTDGSGAAPATPDVDATSGATKKGK